MSELKTKPNDASVETFIDTIQDEVKKQDSFDLVALFRKITGCEPKMWGASIIGFGEYHYKSERSRQEGDWPLVAFSPRKQSLTLYVLTAGPEPYAALLEKLGKHTVSKACLYIKKLSDVDSFVLETLVQRAYNDARQLLGETTSSKK